MDDFDDLLDEVEHELSVGSIKTKKSSSKKVSSLENDIDDLLNDTADTLPTLTKVKSKRVTSTKTSGTTKCAALYIGGTTTPSGLSSFGDKRSCDRLRCTSCDFKVEQFNDLEWMDSVDYLFLRNNMPDFKKVSSRLRRKPGCRAYACQCSWKSAKVLTSLHNCDTKWVCGKH